MCRNIRPLNNFEPPATNDEVHAAALQFVVHRANGVLGCIRTEEATLEDEVEVLIEKRQAARKAKQFAEADRIRDELLAKGIVLEDTPKGVAWRRK